MQFTVRIEVSNAIDRQSRIFGAQSVEQHARLNVGKAAGRDEQGLAIVLALHKVVVD